MWEIIEFVCRNNHHRRVWKCRCLCGNIGYVDEGNLKSGRSKQCSSCGKWNNKRSTKHGLRYTVEYQSWVDLRRRCNNPKNKSYKYYGARGITYDPRWDDFMQFFLDMGGCPKGYSIERIDVNGNYCKENCKWIPKEDQPKNRRNT